MVEKGYLALVLHAHLPYIRHPESEQYIEEKWLFEAITETYLPLLQVFEGLHEDQVPFRLTMSLTPTLLSMLSDPLLQGRYSAYIENLIQLAKKEIKRTADNEDLNDLASMYYKKFLHMQDSFETIYQRNVINGFRRMQDLGYLELITCSATHAFLPYVKTEMALRAQIENAVKVHYQHLGRAPRGIWLPECGYKAELDPILKEFGLEYFFTETDGLMHADPKPTYDVYAPVVTPTGIAAFARDAESSKQVWSSMEGYPGDFDYREYYRDIGYDLDYDYIKPHLHKSGVRLNTGIKYHRITGNAHQKELYHPDWARDTAARHAGNFMFNREQQIEFASSYMNRKPIIVASYDAELFGHWWYEGPMWLDFLCRKIHYDQNTIKLKAPIDYLEEYPENEVAALSMSSWGRGGYGEVWLGQNNEWIYRHLHQAEHRMIELANRFPNPTDLEKRALNQAVRELLLAQSSDWAFIMDAQTMVEYAIKRTKNHIGRFKEIYDALIHQRINAAWLTELERRNAIFPAVDYKTFTSRQAPSAPAPHAPSKLKVLVLSWEFPPMMVGGLSRHVFDLTRKMVELGFEIHVLTSHVDGYPAYEQNQGVHVHRIQTFQSNEIDFMGWIFQLNLAMIDYGKQLINNYGPFDLIHAHDWLVSQSAKTLKHQFQLPLVSTIHATEHGRNQGIHTDIQRKIHHLEWQLTYESYRVIGCSPYMEREICDVFQLPADKLDIIPNGVDPGLTRIEHSDPSIRAHFALPHEKIVFFVGRIVREKGVQILLDCVPNILRACPDAKFVIGGKGPMLEELKWKAIEMGIQDKVMFTGFISDETRNQLLHWASATVFPSLYEPFGIVALEAMAAGAPVIVSDVGGMADIVEHGVDGLKVYPGDHASLTTQIIACLQDEQKAQEMKENALNKVEQYYLWERIAEQTVSVYFNVLKEAQRPLLESYVEAAAARS
ncbi:glycosyl transferase family 1 [Ammoniphilus oxalaticus]|uniref:Glycosyl transferase family 1 n=1 Tax=Ammoniphilus oxalaticus TaxID=66863 RepID=A0A419SLL1_9BACL|nr:1,4-alpha-glucan branching protein domain-containing protein [Ammoniphilus oxalaticus]RKD24959.1 glycosyl transferase family 1 [Ammoniphilus oxalaticus]